jgi:TatD DNase family protein
LSLIDTHAHLNDARFESDVDEVIARAKAAGVERMIVCGYDLESSRASVQLAGRFEGAYATVGIHPHDAKSYSAEIESAIEELSRAPKVLAIGEIGLDYHYDLSPRCAQVAAFEAQVDLAAKLGLPIVVHSRESNDEALQVLAGRAGNIIAGVFHCFSGDVAFARAVLDRGFYIGIDGPVTYKASDKLRAVVEACPLDRLLIETDCPYLTPVPHRGRRNEPAYVRYVAEEAARVKGISFEELAEATSANARKLFGLSI